MSTTKKGFVLYRISDYGTSFHPVYIFPAKEEAEAAQKEFERIYKNYNSLVMHSNNKDQVMYRSLVASVLPIEYYDNGLSMEMWRQKPLACTINGLDRASICSTIDKAKEDVSYFKKKGFNDYSAHVLSLDAERSFIKNQIAELDDDEYVW